MKRYAVVLLISFIFSIGFSAWGHQDVYVYPEKGQTYEQQEKDKFECHNWAVKESDVDPYEGNYPGAGGEVIKGAVVGAAVGAASGAAIGAITGDAGTGAAVGATAGGCTGAMGGARHASRIKHEYKGDYNRAFAACMKGRGYAVN